MKILHTSDWHLGKFLEGNSRLFEQELFLEELCDVCEKEDIDLILVSGDIYDTGNPPAAAERLFYKYTKKLSKDGRRPIVVISGNHDNPERLSAASPIADEQGIIIIGLPKTRINVCEYKYYSIVNSGELYFEIEINGEHAVIIAMPYPSEKRLGELISVSLDEDKMQKSYSERMGSIFSEAQKNYRKNTINLCMGHFYVAGGTESSSERPIQLGGSYEIGAKSLPLSADYIALGHLHRYQVVPGTQKKAYYCGAPIAYAKDEASFVKVVNIVEINAGGSANIKKHYLNNPKPIEIWKVSGIEKAIKMCEENAEKESYVYLYIKEKRTLEQSEIKRLKSIKKNIVEISIDFEGEDNSQEDEGIEEKSIKEQFNEFYMGRRGVKPTEEVMDIFLMSINESEGDNETFNS